MVATVPKTNSEFFHDIALKCAFPDVVRAAQQLAQARLRIKQAESQYANLYELLFASTTGLADPRTGDPTSEFNEAYAAELKAVGVINKKKTPR